MEWRGLLANADKAFQIPRMSRQKKVIMAVIFFGSFIYIILTQAVQILGGAPGEPIHPEIRKFCSSAPKRNVNIDAEDADMPMIYVVTPTYRRPEMVAELTRLGQTLSMVKRIHWIVAEDSLTCSSPITHLLHRLGVSYTHMATPMPEAYRREKYVPRGVSNRRAALQWVQENGEDSGVLYFLDDDNAIDIRLFNEMRSTQTVSMWPVGLIGEYTVSSPVIRNGQVVGFYDGWPAGRKFQVDMAGFSVGVGYLKKQKKVTMPYIAGHEEDGFLKSLNINLKDIEVKANGCTSILVWHTRTAKNPTRTLRLAHHQSTNIKLLTDNMRKMGMIK